MVGPSFDGLTKLATLMEPRVQDSKGRSGCSPQGFVDSMVPRRGVGFPD